jgi:hypothetical protein
VIILVFRGHKSSLTQCQRPPEQQRGMNWLGSSKFLWMRRVWHVEYLQRRLRLKLHRGTWGCRQETVSESCRLREAHVVSADP